MCHALLQDPSFFRLLLRIDEDLAGEARAGGCSCGGVLHRADYQLSVKPEHGPGAVTRNARHRYADTALRTAQQSSGAERLAVVEQRDLAIYEQMLEAA